MAAIRVAYQRGDYDYDCAASLLPALLDDAQTLADATLASRTACRPETGAAA